MIPKSKRGAPVLSAIAVVESVPVLHCITNPDFSPTKFAWVQNAFDPPIFPNEYTERPPVADKALYLLKMPMSGNATRQMTRHIQMSSIMTWKYEFMP